MELLVVQHAINRRAAAIDICSRVEFKDVSPLMLPNPAINLNAHLPRVGLHDQSCW
jgi:hypothetical protein